METSTKFSDTEEEGSTMFVEEKGQIEVLEDTNTPNSSKDKNALAYGIEERPPWLLSILLALQHFSSSFTSCIALPFLVSRHICFTSDSELVTRLIATNFLVTGMGTVLQTLFGCRLPILQGPSAAYMVPLFAMLAARSRDCPIALTATSNETEKALYREEAYARINEVQGAVICASLMQCFIGFTGLIGFILRFIGPITITVTLVMIGFGIVGVAMRLVAAHWCISIPTIALVILFSMVLSKYSIPLPRGKRFRIFAFFPMILAILIMWIVCAILTFAGAFPDDPMVYGYAARVDIKVDNIISSPWVSFPYPGQWGLPAFNIAGAIGICTAVLASVVDSIGDYHACAQVARVPPPPIHAINRGIGVEGFGVFLAGIFGTGLGVTSHSSDIAVLNLTKVASRVVLIQSGIIFMTVAFFTKFSALMNAIPDPVLGSIAVVIAMITAIGLGNIEHVNMNSSRNILVVGISLFAGIGFPRYFTDNPDAVKTGSNLADSLIVVLLSNGMFVGAILSIFLDNVLPGTAEDRGMHWRSEIGLGENDNQPKHEDPRLTSYLLPFGMNWITNTKWTRRLPFSPTFIGFRKIKVPLKNKECESSQL